MEKFLAAVRNMFSVPDLRRRILFTLGMLAVYRLGAHIGAPGINRERLEQVWQDVAGTLLGVLDLFSGGNFRTISIFALGVTPYITASIILQLMTVVYPALKKLQEEGEAGRQKINQWTRYLTVGLAVYSDLVRGSLAPGQRSWRAHLGVSADHGIDAHHGYDLRDVAGRADYGARRRQRYLAIDFRRHCDWVAQRCRSRFSSEYAAETRWRPSELSVWWWRLF